MDGPGAVGAVRSPPRPTGYRSDGHLQHIFFLQEIQHEDIEGKFLFKHDGVNRVTHEGESLLISTRKLRKAEPFYHHHIALIKWSILQYLRGVGPIGETSRAMPHYSDYLPLFT